MNAGKRISHGWTQINTDKKIISNDDDRIDRVYELIDFFQNFIRVNLCSSVAKNASCLLIGPWIIRNVLDRDHGLYLSTTDFGHGIFPQGERVVVAEDVLGGGGQDQP